ncbi:zinc finger protein ZAT3 [Sesamum indicum]|uniref:Zinc finger protein ZAT3 n=1 Tax=Sesamum indicum TaxID=4182 RepID=A0A6I9TXV8_SESIN|nr:zinc finger protein ZAT3 [Sesamum indicum]
MDTNNINNCPSSDDVLSPLHRHPTHNPRKKKRTKFLTIIRDDDAAATTSKPKPTSTRKPDSSAPKITRPCTECGKKFWSWKALFGHMRCHPERQWRGINPPPNLVRQHLSASTEEDHEIATCLLMLANAPVESPSACATVIKAPAGEHYCNSELIGNINSSNSNVVDGGGGFECSSCKKVFGSHQALGGHRASHKNVKGCYANANYKSKEEEEDDDDEEEEILLLEGGWMEEEDDDSKLMKQQQMLVSGSLGTGHKCSICLRVFSSGQALGGHKRCHWEKMEAPMTRVSSCGLDLNCSPAVEEEDVDDEDDGGGGFNKSDSRRVANLDLRLRL